MPQAIIDILTAHGMEESEAEAAVSEMTEAGLVNEDAAEPDEGEMEAEPMEPDPEEEMAEDEDMEAAGEDEMPSPEEGGPGYDPKKTDMKKLRGVASQLPFMQGGE